MGLTAPHATSSMWAGQTDTQRSTILFAYAVHTMNHKHENGPKKNDDGPNDILVQTVEDELSGIFFTALPI